ncbi:WD40-repeat-containing domain protein [Lasiosphaeria miniovina]|uniref:WD40-repeat-containing domain protein n=1 Tax=Lasiosphaeria miniovina TaxID=1954250 RepID=A0AA40AK57_9PEZI|nr:WD40-repeat-containing domain protein [Lasiosphaeria miniovina]KAK0717356.1 WD40-repeat-containing domain protein [Lasiosphaeria miniovina]
MNTRPPLESPSSTVVLSITFNDDCKNFAVGLNTGFLIFESETCLAQTIREFNAGIGLVQMMGKANYIALVGGGRQPKFAANKLILWDERNSKSALEISALTPVRGVQLSKERIVVVLQNSVRVYRFAKPPNLVSSYETANNSWGVCCLSPRIIAFPGRTTGHVQLVETQTGNVTIIPAHSSAVKVLQFSRDGEMLATASEMGTLIRIFATSNGARLVELRRGIDPATIFSLAFNPSGSMLACTSDKSTLHIFDVQHPKRPSSSSPQSGGGSPQASSSGSSDNNNSGTDGGGKGKWGILSKIPLMPRLFSDVYSFASAPFEAGDEPLVGGLPMSESTTLGTSRPPKGIIGWLTDDTLLVVGAGNDARWEKFVVQNGPDGRRQCVREGWKRYLPDA